MPSETRTLGVGLPFSFPAAGAVLLAACFTMFLLTGQVRLGETEFVNKATSLGMLELQSSKLASRSAKRDDVKQFADQMVADHESINKELLEAARDAGLELPAKMLEAHEKLLAKVMDARLGDLDGAYVDTQVKAHREAVALFTRAAKSMKNPSLKKFAEDTLPILKEHYDHAKTCAANHLQ